jgi:Domain of unknown function (DUF4349)
MKSNAKKIWIAVGAVIVLLMMVSAIIPSLLRSRQAAETRATSLGPPTGDVAPMNQAVAPMLKDARAGMGVMGALVGGSDSPPSSYDASHKIIRTASLDLIVKDVPQAIDQIKRETADLGGYVEKATLSNSAGDSSSGTITVRVPQVRLDQAVAGFKQTAARVENENIESADVTKQFVDTESELRNYRAEEQQYLVIMRSAVKVQDTLDVAEKLSDVRGRIESLQGQLNFLSHQVEMSSVTMNVRPQITAVAAAFEWHPLVKARVAFREMLSGLADFVDFITLILINIPLILLWFALIGGAGFYGWKISRWGYVKLRSSDAPAETAGR